MPAFDPYYKWLGIPPEEQPPNHYRLLGINLFEEDAAVISNAADQRMAFLKSVQTGEHVQHSQDLLNQVAQAKLCLLDAGKRRAYDATLGDRPTAFLKKDQDRSRPQPTSGPGTVPPKYAVDAGDSMRRGTPPRTLSSSPPRQSLFSRIPSWALVAVVSGALVLVVSVLLRPGPESPDPPDGDWQQERDELLAEVARLGDLVEQRNRESQVRIQGLEQERSESLADIKRLSELVKQRDRELQRLKDNTEPPPESLVANLKVGLVAYYPFNGNAKDESGNGHDGEVNGPQLTADRFGRNNTAYSFDGNDTISLSDGLKEFAPTSSQGLTFSFWSKKGTRGFIASQYANYGASNFFITIGESGAVSLVGNGTGKPNVGFIRNSSERVLEEWNHWVFQLEPGDANSMVYLNGELEITGDAFWNNSTSDTPFLIGAISNSKDKLVGQIDDVRIYDRALSAAEVKALYDHESTPPDITASKPKPPPTAPKLSDAQLALAAPIKELMTPKQEDLGGPVVNSIDIVLVPIPAGEFTMGSPESEPDRQRGETQHRVRITKAFYLSVHEVTQAQYEWVMGNNPSAYKGPTKPVEVVSWKDAVVFCDELSKREGEKYRLPTEAEWEYACRAGTTTAYSFGDDVRQLPQHAWYSGSSNGSTHPVGELKPNAWGLFDMHGNVREWCQDWHGRYESLEVSDPTGAASGRYRVLRGGAFFLPPKYVRAATRLVYPPENLSLAIGFRLTRTYPLSPAVTGPTVDKPKPRAEPPKMSRAQRVLAAPIKKLMTPEQVDLGGPIVNTIDIVLVPIPAGEFTMGSPESEPDRRDTETQHRVRITKPFYLSAHEVTQQQYERVMGNNPSSSKGPTKPVEHVSWKDAVAFCDELSKREGKKYRLPTEAEWEYACRAGTSTAYSSGDAVSGLGEYAWHDGNSGNATHPVGELKPNAWGLFDMHGNVREWCQDWLDNYDLKVVSDPIGPASGSKRVLRGGAFTYQAGPVRAAGRINHGLPDNRSRNLGFRLARTYPLSPITGPTVEKPKPRAEPPKLSDAQLALAAPIKELMTPKQKDLGGPIVNSIDMVLVPIPAGEFTMGSPQTEEGRGRDETQHLVRITKPFYLSAHEVTQAQYEQVMGNNPSSSKGDTKPVEHVSWNNAIAFCDELSKREGEKYRLPTEAQWEYACRAGTTTAYSFGGNVTQLGDYAWYSENSGNTAHLVGQKKPNPWGLFDMHGNVWEWCQDRYGPYKSLEVSDPTGPASGDRRVLRGGAFHRPPKNVRAAYRANLLPDSRYRSYGFRLTRTYNLSP